MLNITVMVVKSLQTYMSCWDIFHSLNKKDLPTRLILLCFLIHLYSKIIHRVAFYSKNEEILIIVKGTIVRERKC